MRAFVLGSTGEIGKELVKALQETEAYTHVTLFTRQQVTVPGQKFEQRILDFEDLSNNPQNHTETFKGFVAGFCALGTTLAKSGKDGFYRVDHDYVVNSAKLAAAAGVKNFNLVSSGAANKNSLANYLKVKGQVEEEVCQEPFQRISIFRPGVLRCNRTESRPVEKFLQFAAGAFDKWNYFSVTTEAVAKAMVSNSINSDKTGKEIIDNRTIGKFAPK